MLLSILCNCTADKNTSLQCQGGPMLVLASRSPCDPALTPRATPWQARTKKGNLSAALATVKTLRHVAVWDDRRYVPEVFGDFTSEELGSNPHGIMSAAIPSMRNDASGALSVAITLPVPSPASTEVLASDRVASTR